MSWRIGEILVQKKLVSWDQLAEVLDEQKKTKEMTGEILVRRGYISQPLLYKALAEQYQLRFVDISRTHINPKALELVPRSIAEKYMLFPIEVQNSTLTIGISNPLPMWPETELRELTGISEIKTVLCLPADIVRAIAEYYPQS